MEISRCTTDDCKYLAELNKELINAEGSDNPMTIRELEECMKLQTSQRRSKRTKVLQSCPVCLHRGI